jgi:YHS domain-containing protein
MRIAVLSVGTLVVAAAAWFAPAIAADEKFDAKCPVSGKAASMDHSVDYKGRKVYFCCENCPKAFEKDPAKFMAKTAVQLLGTKQATQIACPLSGKPVDPETAIDVEGVAVAFCCNNCKGAAEKSDDAVAMLFGKEKNVKNAITLQTTCPVSSKPIKADKFVEYKGEKVYFCCPGCPPAFEKDPAKFAAKVPQLSGK